MDEMDLDTLRRDARFLWPAVRSADRLVRILEGMTISSENLHGMTELAAELARLEGLLRVIGRLQ